MPTPNPYVSNIPLNLSANARFINDNGDLVTQLYPIGFPVDTPTTGYISRIGSLLSNQIDLYNQVTAILGVYGTDIAALQVDVAAIQASGSTSIPYVNGGCLTTPVNQSVQIDTALALLIPAWCDTSSVLGTPTQLSTGVAAEDPTTLNALPAYSQNSAMAGLSGWLSSPATVGESIKNLWLAYLDMRVGVTQALSQSAITCADVAVSASGVYNSSEKSITLYFGSSNVPSNFSDNTSSLTVTDTSGTTYAQNFNVVTAVNAGNLVIDLSSSALLQTSDYVVTLTIRTTSTTPSLGCETVRVIQVLNTTQVCPNVSVLPSATAVLYTFTPAVTNADYAVNLLNTSGVTIDTQNYSSSAGVPAVVISSFSGLSSSTGYAIQVVVTESGAVTTCSSNAFVTSS